jgi:hypothetical protein
LLIALFTLAYLPPQLHSDVSAVLFYETTDTNVILARRPGCLVRIQCRLSRRRYLGGKQMYEYERLSLYIPRRFHNKFRPFLKQDLSMQVTTKEDSLVITLTPS